MYWYEKEAPVQSAVLSTRVRFARNLEDTPFPHLLSDEEKNRVFDRVKEAYRDKDVLAVPFSQVDSTVKEAYVQTHLASTLLARQSAGGLLLSRQGDVAIMVCEEDHVRLQVICPGFAPQEAFQTALAWIRHGEENLPIAYRKNLGYLTACPTNLGGAMRISVMIHLPSLVATGGMDRLIRNLNDAGYTVRGLFGEGSRQGGDIFQISNQRSREKEPDQIVREFEQVIGQVEEMEQSARERLLEKDRLSLEDQVFRALGTLKYARKMSYQEFITLYSRVRFGKEAKFAEVEGISGLDRLFVELSPAPMLLRDRTLTEPALRDEKRSRILRETLG